MLIKQWQWNITVLPTVHLTTSIKCLKVFYRDIILYISGPSWYRSHHSSFCILTLGLLLSVCLLALDVCFPVVVTCRGTADKNELWAKSTRKTRQSNNQQDARNAGSKAGKTWGESRSRERTWKRSESQGKHWRNVSTESVASMLPIVSASSRVMHSGSENRSTLCK